MKNEPRCLEPDDPEPDNPWRVDKCTDENCTWTGEPYDCDYERGVDTCPECGADTVDEEYHD